MISSIFTWEFFHKKVVPILAIGGFFFGYASADFVSKRVNEFHTTNQNILKLVDDTVVLSTESDLHLKKELEEIYCTEALHLLPREEICSTLDFRAFDREIEMLRLKSNRL